MRRLTRVSVGAVLVTFGLASIGPFATAIHAHHDAGAFLFEWSAAQGNLPQLASPAGVAADSGGSVYVADTGNTRIVKLTYDGSSIAPAPWDGTGLPGGFGTLRTVTAGPGGFVYGTDSAKNRVVKFTSDGAFIGEWDGGGALSGPWAVAVSPKGEAYITDSLNDRILRFDSSMSDPGFVVVGGGAGLFRPRGIAIGHSGILVVADSGNNRIVSIEPSGSVTSWGGPGSGDGQFNTPEGMAVDPLGNVYVADSGNARIQKLGANGDFIDRWGSSGSGDGQFFNVQGVAIGSGNVVYAADTGNNRIQAFDSAERFPATRLPALSGPGMALMAGLLLLAAFWGFGRHSRSGSGRRALAG